jgi:hypothetical protein
MDTESVISKQISSTALINRFSDIGLRIDERQLTNILSILVSIGSDDDLIEEWLEYPKLPDGIIGFIVPTTYYNINVKRASLMLAAVITDALVTYGLLSAGLTMSGLAKQSIAKLDTTSGEYCCAIQAIKLNEEKTEITATAIRKKINGKACPFVKLNCRFMQNNRCTASQANIQSLLVGLHEKGAVTKKHNKWQVPY